MALHAVCPNCKSGFTLPDEVAGKKVRCKNCQVIFAVQVTAENQLDELEEADPNEEVEEVEAGEEVEAVEEVEEVEAVEPAPREKPSTLKPARPRVEEVEAVQEVEAVEDTPAAPRSKSALRKTAPVAAEAPAYRKSTVTPEKTDRSRRGGARTDPTGARGGPRPLDDDHASPARQTARPNHLPLILGTVLVGLVILVGGGIGLAFILRGSSPSPPVANAPPQVYQPPPPVLPPAPGPVVIPILPAEAPAPLRDNNVAATDPKTGKIGQDAKEKVKRATVFLRVTMPDGSKASGTGFFGCAESPRLILTNAHVVGMLSADSTPPDRVEVVLNSGDADLEDEGQAKVLGVDRSSDLAVLDLYPATKKQKPLPTPITVKTAENLTELDEVYVFGFPLGDKLGKEITIRPSSVSSLRKINGTNILDKIQVNGGMDPGNSGGPVVDNTGGVVGVAVSGIQGRMINFAIPGERVHTILNGRIAELGTGQPYVAADKQIGVPINVVLLDPRNLVKDVFLEVWTGNPGPPRPPSKKKPEQAVGDSAHQRFPLVVSGRERKGEMMLPPAQDGKAYWLQPVFTNGAGETHWVAANVYQLSSQPVERKPADLVFRPALGVRKDLTLTHDQSFKIGNDEDGLFGKTKTKVGFDTRVDSFNQQQGASVTLQYLNAEKTNFIKVGDKGGTDDFKAMPSDLVAKIGPTVKQMRGTQVYDPTGNLKGIVLDARPVATVSAQGKEALLAFHGPITEALKSVAVPLPNKEKVQPKESWKATRNFPVETPERAYVATFNLTYTYLGQRRRDNRDEAVIAIAGELEGIDGKNAKVAATMSGTALVDLATGEVILARTNMVMDQQITVKTPEAQLTLRGRISAETRVEYSKPR